MCINIRSTCSYRPSLMTLNNDAETKRCMGDRIRGCVSISDAETKRCKEDRIGGCVSISDQFAFIDPL